MKLFKKKKAQQLIEFLLVAPFMIIILGVLTEYAYALNINMTLTQGLKTVTSSIYSKISPSTTKSTIDSLVASELQTYLSNNNVPLNSENALKVSSVVVSNQTSIFMATYKYYPAFTLPNTYFRILPEEFDFLATAAIPTAFISSNNYSSGITSTDLDKIWSSTADFSSLDSFNSSKNGIMKSGTADRQRMIFLVPNSSAKTLGYSNLYALVNWTGSILMSGTNTYNANLSTGMINTCSATSCSATSTPFKSFITTSPNSYYNIIIINDDDADDITTLKNNWAYNTSGSTINVDYSTDISSENVDGILKRALAIITPPSSSVGNYDNISASSYKVTALGSMVICAPTSVSISSITSGTPYNVNYIFTN